MTHTLFVILIIAIIVGIFILLINEAPIDDVVKKWARFGMILVAALYLLDRFAGTYIS